MMRAGRGLRVMAKEVSKTSSHDGNQGAAREATREVSFLLFPFVLLPLFSDFCLSLVCR